MARMIPDQSFYPSPGLAMSAPPETLAYVAMLNPRGGSDAIGRARRRSRSRRATAGWSVSLDMPKRRRRAASLRLERVQLVPLPATRRTRTWSAAI